MDQEIREAEKASDWQRVYALLNRANRHDEARALFLDHPIKIECTVQYCYRIHWNRAWSDNYVKTSLSEFNLNDLIEAFIKERTGASKIYSIVRMPIYELLGREMKSESMRDPLPRFSMSQERLQKIKEQIKAHPGYMQGATSEQLAAAAEADAKDAERMIQDTFKKDSELLREKGWSLWVEHNQLSRPEFAQAIDNYRLRYVLFHMKGLYTGEDGNPLIHAEATGKGAWARFIDYWYKNSERRFCNWKNHNLPLERGQYDPPDNGS